MIENFIHKLAKQNCGLDMSLQVWTVSAQWRSYGPRSHEEGVRKDPIEGCKPVAYVEPE